MKTTPSFVCELPLRAFGGEEHVLRVRFDCARQAYNACLAETLRRLDLMRQSKAYAAARQLPKGKKGSAERKARAAAFSTVNAKSGFREYDLHAWAAEHIKHEWLGEHLDINTIQKLATRAFQAAQQHAFGKRGRPRFKGRQQLDSLEGKTNAAGIRWREDAVEWSGLHLPAIIDPQDPVIAHGLASRIKYVRLVRRRLGVRGMVRYFVQLICEGRPFQKEKNAIGDGTVGLDIGPSTIAAVAPDAQTAFLEPFCRELKAKRKAMRRWQHKIDRQRRASNPGNYNLDGTAKAGKREWRKSGKQRQTQARLAHYHRTLAAQRQSLHGKMANRILRLGNHIKLEKLSYRSLQRNFGRSVNFRAPGLFVAILRRKAESAGAQVNEFPTAKTRLSQTCHGCGTIQKKALSQRWHMCECGIVAQRDLYSAFLASCVEDERLDADRAKLLWSGADPLLQAASSRQQQLASGGRVPASFGLGGNPIRSQSRSPVAAGGKTTEAPDVVPCLSTERSRESWREVIPSSASQLL